jgi:hypothetical protein
MSASFGEGERIGVGPPHRASGSQLRAVRTGGVVLEFGRRHPEAVILKIHDAPRRCRRRRDPEPRSASDCGEERHHHHTSNATRRARVDGNPSSMPHAVGGGATGHAHDQRVQTRR